MAKTFFFVCAGLSLLVMAISGAMQARASGGSVEVGGIDGEYYFITGVSGRSVTVGRIDPIPGPLRNLWVLPPVPGTSRIVAVNYCHNYYSYVVLLENGDCYGSAGGEWTLTGNLLKGGPTPAKESSWGSIKARYR